jgi:tryptophanyl-tRNA synthetase
MWYYEDMSKIILSGVKPTGRPHLGNYFGAMKQFVELQNEHEGGYFFIADYHALNLIQDAKELREAIRGIAAALIAIGLDPEKSIIFKQSDIPEHTELCWIFDTIVTLPYLSRSHAFKAALGDMTDARPAQRFLASKLEQLPEINVGTFNYPVLMAADILLYDTDLVPVGQDQKQHVEYARDIAEKFNRTFGPSYGKDIFKLPNEYILPNVETVKGTDGRKMSKSYNNTIPLFASDEEIEKAVMSIVTDSSGERPANVYAIHKLIRPESELKKIYEENKGKYKVLKEALIEDLKNFIGPLREKRKEVTEEMIDKVLSEGKEKAGKVARAKMVEVKKAIGVE